MGKKGERMKGPKDALDPSFNFAILQFLCNSFLQSCNPAILQFRIRIRQWGERVPA
jgi:hypothetical protein